MNVLVVGLGVTGEAVARDFLARGHAVSMVDDAPERREVKARADELAGLGGRTVDAGSATEQAHVVEEADLVVPSPGVPVGHPILMAAQQAGTEIRSEIDLAGERARAQGGPVLVAVTGTNGKTTVTTLAAGMLERSGRQVAAAGNIGRPLLSVIGERVDIVVAEVSSFQLEFSVRFRPQVAVILNVAEDHLDWHPSHEKYIEAKARVFARQEDGDLLVFNHDDPVVCRLADSAPARKVGFSLRGSESETFRVESDALVDPAGNVVAEVRNLALSSPHDLANALAAAAASLDIGATREGVRSELGAFTGLPHRVHLVGKARGVRYVDDSKATNPHATLNAIEAFERVVLLAGGRNKGLDLSIMVGSASHLRVVIAFGEAGPEIEAAFSGAGLPVIAAPSMTEAVAAAAVAAETGDTVLLSPGCASFDWYASYAERGDDFIREVAALPGFSRADKEVGDSGRAN